MYCSVLGLCLIHLLEVSQRQGCRSEQYVPGGSIHIAFLPQRAALGSLVPFFDFADFLQMLEPKHNLVWRKEDVFRKINDVCLKQNIIT